MNKIKETLIITTGALAFVLLTGTAKADPQTVIDNLVSVPGKLQNHIQMEITKTKEFQKQSWAEAKAQWSALITKLSSK